MLEESKIQEIVQKRPHKKEIDQGIKHQERLRLHSEVILNKANLSPAYTDFINWLGTRKPELLPEDKLERFKQLCTVPLPTVSLCDDIFTYLFRVFESQDKFFRYEFEDAKLKSDWAKYTNPTFWQTAGFEALKTGIDSVWIADIDDQDDDDYPRPKDKLIDIDCVIDIDNDRDNNCEYVIFAIHDKLYVYDDVFIRIYNFENKKIGAKEYELAHELGYTPARSFWNDPLIAGNKINKKAPLTPVLGDLDWLLAMSVFKKYMDMSNAYPIIAAYEQGGGFNDQSPQAEGSAPVEQTGNANSFIGPGTFWGVRPPAPGEPDLMSNPIKLITPDVDTLKYHETAEDRLMINIFRKVTGYGGEPENNQAKNEKQILSGFESQMIKLSKIAKGFEEIQTFADKCKAELRYGPDAVMDVSVDYGSRFFLKSVAELTSEISDNKEKGIDDAVIDTMTDELLETKYRNDKNGLLRARIMRDIDPLPDKTFAETKEIYDAGGISKINFIIKVNKISFAKRFEREQLPLQFFGENLDYAQRLNKIKEEFVKYAEEFNSSEQRPESNDQRV